MVTSPKLTAFNFVSQVILRSKYSLKFFIKCSLILSAWGLLIYSEQANQSSLYKPILCCSILLTYKPTSSHNSAPSKLSIVTSKSGFSFFFIRISVLISSRDFLECMMVLISSSLIFTKVFAYVRAFSKQFL